MCAKNYNSSVIHTQLVCGEVRAEASRRRYEGTWGPREVAEHTQAVGKFPGQIPVKSNVLYRHRVPRRSPPRTRTAAWITRCRSRSIPMSLRLSCCLRLALGFSDSTRSLRGGWPRGSGDFLVDGKTTNVDLLRGFGGNMRGEFTSIRS